MAHIDRYVKLARELAASNAWHRLPGMIVFSPFTWIGPINKFESARSSGGPGPGMTRKDPLWHRNRLSP